MSLDHYCGEKGLLRFVTGDYSLKHAAAVMVAVSLEERGKVISAIRGRLQQNGVGGALRMKQIGGSLLQHPSGTFPLSAEFDTRHERPLEKAAKDGSIQVSHVILNFGYPAPPPAPKKPRRKKPTA